MKAILDKFDIDETLTKPIKKNKIYTKVKSVIPLVKNWNYAIDVIELPETKENFDRLLTICDLANNAFDIEPMKKNKSPDETMKALNKIFTRKYIKKPKYSITSDPGVEFKGAFDKFCKDNAIFHRVGLTGRHAQNAVIERLHREIGRIINGYLNSKERKTGHIYKEWFQIIPQLREELNNFRIDKTISSSKKEWFNMERTAKDFSVEHFEKPKFEINDLVHRQLDYSKDIHGNKLYGNFRMGDYRYEKEARKIINILIYPEPVQYRYVLNGIKIASFTNEQLKLSNQTVEKFNVKQFKDKKIMNKKIYYLVRWLNLKKENDSWELANNLIEDLGKDIFDEHVQDYQKRTNAKKKTN